MKINRNLLSVWVVSMLLLSSCRVKVPSDVIQPKELKEILYDYHIAQGTAENMQGDIQQNTYMLIQKVFEKHHITQAEFDSSMVWYCADASRLEKIYQELSARIDNESEALGISNSSASMYANLSAQGDTANIWMYSNQAFLLAKRGSNLRKYKILADSTFRKGDEFLLSFRSLFVSQDYQREGVVMLDVTYKNGRCQSNTTSVRGDNTGTVRLMPLEQNKEQEIEDIRVSFYMPYDDKEEKFYLMMLSDIALVRFHQKTEEKIETDSIS